MELATLISLKKLNKPIAAKPIKPALTDKQVRAEAQQQLADGRADKKTVTGIESALRQSRRVNARYETAHVHVGAEPQAGHTEVPALTADKALSEETQRVRAAEGRAGVERAAQSAELEKYEKGSARESFGDGRGNENLADSENVASSTGSRFRQTERAAAAKVAAAREHDQVYDKLAWDAFERDHATEAAEISKVWERATKQPDPALVERSPDNAFAIAAASFLKKNTRAGSGRSRRQGELAEMWRTWCAYRKQWERKHPGARLPEAPRVEHRYTGWYPDIQSVPEAVSAVLRVYRPRPVASPTPAPIGLDPLVVDWEARGMPMGESAILGSVSIKPLEQTLQQIDGDWWSGSELAQRHKRNNATVDYWARYRTHKPRSLLPV